MTTPLISISSLVLTLSWQADPLTTYTVQSSPDMRQWTTLPYVVSASAMVEHYSVHLLEEACFLRLQHGPDGDSNSNGLPDVWEWQEFGYLDVDALGDPDEDGRNNYVEWVGGTDPHDFYNGEQAVLHLGSGREWLVPSGEVSTESLVVRLTHADGTPWADAPIGIDSGQSGVAIVQVGETAGPEVTQLIVWTDAFGMIRPGLESVHLRAPTVDGERGTVEVRAGSSSEHIGITAVGGGFVDPPRELTEWTDADRHRNFRWKGDPGPAERFVLQESGPDGTWSTIIEIPVVAFSAPDPEDGSYHLVIE